MACASRHHTDWVRASCDISEDRNDAVVMPTGTGDEFITVEQWDLPCDQAVHWDRIYRDGKRLLQNLLDIEVPMIGAIDGPAYVHAKLGMMSDITPASAHATFRDAPHVPGGVAPTRYRRDDRPAHG